MIKFGRRAFRPGRPPRLGKSTFGRFRPVSGPERPRNFSKSPRPLQKPVNHEFPVSQNIPEKWPVAPGYGRNSFLSIGTLTEKTGPQPTTRPQPTPKRPYLGSQGHRGPQKGSLGPHLQCDQIWSVGVSPRADPRTGKIHLLVFLARFEPQTGSRNF